MKYSDAQRVEKIQEYATKLLAYVSAQNIEKQQLLQDYSIQWLVTTPLYNIGEHAYQLSAEYKQQHTQIPWMMLSGLRHRLVHDYAGTNWNIIADVVYEELPLLLQQLGSRNEATEN